MTERTADWKKGYAQCIAGVSWNDTESEHWQAGWSAAFAGLAWGRIRDVNNVIGKWKQAAAEAERDVWLPR